MPNSTNVKAICASLILLVTCQSAVAQDDVADIRSKKFILESKKLQYFLIGAAKKRDKPTDGYKLLIALPGGDGSEDFLPFVKRIYKHALNDDYLALQLVAPKWTSRQKIVWPTAGDKVRGKKVPVEDFLKSAVDDLRQRTRIDDRHVYTLSWSSGGPAAYAASLSKNTPVTGSFVAMSVFKPRQIPDLTQARGKRYYILHSREDKVCPFRMAETARDVLTEHGAKVEFTEYQGGHGWRGNVFGNIRQGVVWLEENAE